MNETNSRRLSGRCLSALRSLLSGRGGGVDLQAAHKLGTQAVRIGLETLDMARIHDQALVALILPGSSPIVRYDMASKAALFFTEALAPIERTHRLVLKADADLKKLKAALARQTVDLETSTLELQDGIKERKAAEEALRAHGDESVRLLDESRRLQGRLQSLVRKILATQENERRTFSSDLQGEVAQTLLGIQIRLLTLKNEVSLGNEDFEKEIAQTQRLVDRSVGTIDRLAHEFGLQYEN